MTPNELVHFGRCIQLASEGLLTLSDAEEAYLQALDADSEYVPALLDLGWYYYAVEDDASRALPLFEKALEISKKATVEAVEGRDECRQELATSGMGSDEERSE